MKVTFKELTEQYLLNADITNESKETYSRCVNVFKQWVVISGRNITELKRADILAYKTHLSKTGKSDSTIELYLRVISKMYEYAENAGWYENIAAGIRIQNRNRAYKRGHLSQQETLLLLSSIDRSTIIGKRDFAIINLMLRCGLRCIEVARLRVCDLERTNKGGYLTIQRKGRLSRSEKIGITLKSVEPIMEYLDSVGFTGLSDSMFKTADAYPRPLRARTLGEIIAKRLKACGLSSPKITAHSLRHTAAVLAILNKVPLKEVQSMLGHRSPETTELYLKSIEAELRLDNPAGKALDDVF